MSTMVISPDQTFEVTGESAARSLDADVGATLTIVSVTPEPGRAPLVRYWTGKKYYHSYADAFTFWARRGQLRRIMGAS